MKTAALAPLQETFGPPAPCSQEHGEHLETQITELSAHSILIWKPSRLMVQAANQRSKTTATFPRKRRDACHVMRA